MKYFFLLTCVDVKQWSNLVRLGHPRGLYEDVVELVVALGQLDNLVNQIVLESNIFVNNILLDKVNLTKYYRHVLSYYLSDLQSAADAAVLHPDHGLVGLDQRRVVDQTLVDVELGHVVDDDGALEVLLVVLGLEDVFQQRGLARPQEAAEQRDGHQAGGGRILILQQVMTLPLATPTPAGLHLPAPLLLDPWLVSSCVVLLTGKYDRFSLQLPPHRTWCKNTGNAVQCYESSALSTHRLATGHPPAHCACAATEHCTVYNALTPGPDPRDKFLTLFQGLHFI